MKKFIISLSAFIMVLLMVAIVIGRGNNSEDTYDDSAIFLYDEMSEESKPVSIQDHIDDNKSTRIYSAIEMPRELENQVEQILYRKGA